MADEQLPRRVYKGIPDRWRMAAWWTMAEERATLKGKGKGKRSAEELGNDYRVRPTPYVLPLELMPWDSASH